METTNQRTSGEAKVKIIEKCEQWFNKQDIGAIFTRNEIAEAAGVKSSDLAWFFNKMKREGQIQTVSRDSYLTTYQKTIPGTFIRTEEPIDQFLRMKL